MKIVKTVLLTAAITALPLTVSANQTINGAGSTFAHPIISSWAESYHKESGLKLNYQAIGSGGGIRQIEGKTVDFGASDAPLDPARLEAQNLVQFPIIIGAIVPVINVPGIDSGELKLTGQLLGDIYLGKIKTWNDAQIQELNPGVSLPPLPIIVVHRSDGSGTTFNFTHYLGLTNDAWTSEVGVNTDVAWPRQATTIGGKGNAGVANFVTRTRGAIGYVEFAYAKQNDMTHTLLSNQEGNFVEPNLNSFSKAAANADWVNTPTLDILLNDQPGAESWPMTAATFVLMHEDQQSAEKAKAILDFFKWSFAPQGAEHAIDLDYIPMPTEVVEIIESVWTERFQANGESLYN
ncbi:phosphate ABC transporter substrate-binding protein PstS [Shewanella sp. TC10]|uniref:phosphate ABC transporter substrate-binding protein PstS n=1 Tax=Shewanella sp. TC10 TaxID=1419739 RepID=UPI00129D4BB7|nr:phosphate ABC transporter substrate-binding protein PstS [Shewanella sp. TC10]